MPLPLQFGTPNDGPSVPRRAAYALIRDARGRFLAVQGPGGLFLPGGGCESGESPEETLAREIREETGQALGGFEYRSMAIQHFVADGVPYRMTAFFYTAVLAGPPAGDGEEELVWVAHEETPDPWYHACHAWVVRSAAAEPLSN